MARGPAPSLLRSRRPLVALVTALVVVLGVLVVPTPAQAATTDRLRPGQSLPLGGTLTSSNGQYRLVLQTDGNLVLVSPGRPMWWSGTRGTGHRLTLQTDGNLVLSTQDGRVAWSTSTRDGNDLQVQSDGNLVLYGGTATARTVSWYSHTPNDTLGVGQRLTPGDVLLSADYRYRWTLGTEGDLVLTGPGRTIWQTGTRATASELVMQEDGNLVLYGGGKALWNTGTRGRNGAVAVLRTGRVEVVQGGVTVWRSPSPAKLFAGQTLQPGEAIASPSGRYQLVAQEDGNLVFYSPGGYSWATMTFAPISGLTLQGDGNLVLYFSDGRPAWYSGTRGSPPGELRMQDDGHLVLYAANGAAVWHVWARSAGIDAAVAAAAAFGAASGERTAVTVLDRTTGLLYGAGDVGGSFASASLVKVFIAARLLSENAQADPGTADLMYRMITQSDDNAATALWPRAGGAGVTDWVMARYGIGGLGHPTQAGWWGLTQIVPTAMVQFYAAVANDPAVGPWLMNAMANASHSAADGWNQWFGIPSAAIDWKVKQGWMCCLDSRSRLHSTGFVDGGRYAVAIFTDGATSYYGQRGMDVVTGAAVRLLPGNRMPT